MGKQTIKAMVQGGKAVPGPPLGPALAMAKLNIGQVIAKINEATRDFAGVDVPIEVIVDTETKEFEIKVGSPPVSQLIKKEVKVDKMAKNAWKKVEGQEGGDIAGNISLEKVVDIAKSKKDSLKTPVFKNAVKQVIATCVSCGVTVEGKHPKEILKEIDEGKWDEKIKE